MDKDTAFLLKQRLSYVLKPDKNNTEGKYKVSSVYFDDNLGTALFEKQNGLLNREKFRVRYYNDSMETVHLESKQKHGNMIYKQHVPLTPVQHGMMLNSDYVFMRDLIFGVPEAPDLLERFYTTGLRRHIFPVVTVEYERQAYVHPLGDVRITFDSNITAKMPGANQSYVVLPDYREVLELKYTHFIPSPVTDLLSGFQLTQQLPVSKFAMSRLVIQGKHIYRPIIKGGIIQ